ncbi:MAG: gamma-glutamyl-gamma-aminobutyrate hydrolase family protein [Candidatus Eisenbacteria bacterium]|nr:gamma-glutamyl-gamma-aminobutyrate hydrolase family protein [Candidatus Eisenbacteria bacterium]
MSRRPRLVVLSNDAPDSSYGARRLAGAFGTAFDATIVEPQGGLGAPRAWLAARGADALVLSGSERSVTARLPWMEEEGALLVEAVARRLPVLAVCFGHQLLGRAFGAEVVREAKRIGLYHIELVGGDPLFAGLGHRALVPEQHGDQLERVPHGFDLIATSDYCGVQAIRRAGLPVYGVQFHPCYGDDVFDADDAWEATGLRGRFAHDGADILANAARIFRAWIG